MRACVRPARKCVHFFSGRAIPPEFVYELVRPSKPKNHTPRFSHWKNCRFHTRNIPADPPSDFESNDCQLFIWKSPNQKISLQNRASKLARQLWSTTALHHTHILRVTSSHYFPNIKRNILDRRLLKIEKHSNERMSKRKSENIDGDARYYYSTIEENRRGQSPGLKLNFCITSIV